MPDRLEKGEYLMTLRHTSERNGVKTVEEFRTTFTVGDETSKEEMLSWQVGRVGGRG